MKKQLLTPLLVLFLLALPTAVSAQVTTIPDQYPSLYRGVRQLGMGNAGIAMPGTDEAAPYYNPASIHDYEKKLRFRVLSPAIDLSTATIGLTKDIFDLADELDTETGDASAQTDTFETFADQHIGEFHSIDIRFPVVTLMHQWFFFSILTDSRNTFSFRNRTFTNVEMLSRSDAGGVLGGAYGFFDDQLEVGLALKILYRLLVSEVVTTSDIITTSSFGNVIDLNRGIGVGADLGVKGQIPRGEIQALEYLKPTAGFTWQDIADTRFGGGAGRTQQSVSLGVGIHPTHHLWGREWESHFAVDIRELNRPSSFPKKFFLGYEFMAPRWGIFRPSVRLGANQLYLAAGATLDLRFFKLEFATYGEEAGPFSRQKQIRKIAANISAGF